MLTSEMIKEAALAAGADMCGIGSMDRFEGAPKEMDPRYIFPEAKSVIGMVFRIPRGVQRGIEEGTQFYQYPSMAYGGINEIYAPAVLYQVGQVIEDNGYEAFIYRNTGARGCVSDMDGSPGNTLSPEEQIEAGGKLIKHLDNCLESRVTDSTQRVKFVLAAYNAGLGHVYDAQRLAEKYGMAPDVWDDNVDFFILNKSKAQYYNDTCCRAGYLRGSETYRFVEEVIERYYHYKAIFN